MTLADKIVVLRAGVVEQVGAPLDLYDDPANMFVAGFIGSPKMNFLPADVVATEAGQVTVAVASQPEARLTLPIAAPVKTGDKVTLGVRPEHFAGQGQGDMDLAVDVDVAEHLGNTSYIYAHVGTGERIVIEREESRSASNRDRLTVGVTAKQSFLFDSTGKRLR
jgi:lactose/L-arabinose transport system ATP-binding protein